MWEIKTAKVTIIPQRSNKTINIKNMKSILGYMLEKSFDLENKLNEMARIGYMGIKNRENYFEIYIRTNDPGNIPHVHIRDADTMGEKFSSCVKLESAEYFTHGGKYKDKFNSKERKAFDEFMNKYEEDFKMTNFEYCLREWNRNNSSHKIDLDISKPDYTKLK